MAILRSFSIMGTAIGRVLGDSPQKLEKARVRGGTGRHLECCGALYLHRGELAHCQLTGKMWKVDFGFRFRRLTVPGPSSAIIPVL
jgi:hypothetical protein